MSPSPQPGVLTIMEQPTHNNLGTSTASVTDVTCAALNALHSITTSTTTTTTPPTQAQLNMTIIQLTAPEEAVDTKTLPKEIEAVIEDNNNLTDKEIKEVVASDAAAAETNSSNGEIHEETDVAAINAITAADDDDEDNNNDSYILDKPRKVLLSSVNPYITCGLCKGYLIDATTIVECLHSFCHSCIMKHLHTNKYCPRCELLLNGANPNIKSDTTLQAIVYKLVPELYEKELMRKRAFYRDRPADAAAATPEQRGDDTENLIFSPSENMSLSLEYADLEDLQDNRNESSSDSLLRKPIYLNCPAIFRVENIKKFVFAKFSIDSNLFDIEIMYKVKTIVLLNHYTLMDVAYVYTWKRDTPMRFYFRVKKARGFSKKLAVKKLLLQKQKQEMEVATMQKIKEDEKKTMIKKNDVQQEQTNTKCDSKADITSLPEPKVKEMKSAEVVKPSKKVSQLEIDVYDYDASQHSSFEIIPSPKFKRNSSNFSDDLKMKLVNKSKNKHNGVKFYNSPLHGFASAEQTTTNSPSPSTKKEPKSSKKSSPSTKSAIKMKFDLSKQNSVTIINMSDPDRKEIVKPIKPEKKNKNNKLLTVPPLTIKKNTMTTTVSGHNHHTTGKSNGKPLVSENPDVIKLIPQKDFEERKEDVKSDFLESFSLTPISSLNSAGSSPEKEKNKDKDVKKDGVNSSSSGGISSKSNDTTFVKPMALLFGSTKRKNKDPIKELPSSTFKKPKLDLNKTTVDGTLRPIKPAKKVDISKLSLSRNKKEEHKTIKLGPIDEALKVIQPQKKVDFVKFVAPRPVKKEEEPVLRLAPLENILKPEVSKAKKSPSPPLFGAPPMKGHIAPPGSTTPHPNLPGNRTPGSKRYQTILPKTPRNNPFANIPNDVNRILQGAGTEIKSISSKESGTKIYGPPNSNATQMGPPAPPPRQSQGKGQSNSNYLNLALFNSSKSKGNEVPPGCRTPMYSPSSPIYSPNSPSYAPNFNIPIRKYTPNTPAATKPSSTSPTTSPNSANLLQNMLNRQTKQFDGLFPSAPKKSSPSPPPSQSTEQQKTEKNNKSNKRAFPGSTSPSSEPPGKHFKSLLDSCKINIPSSLSITITNDDAESKSPNSAGSKHKSPVNNYIEILKLPDKVEAAEKPKASLPPPQKTLPPLNGKASPTKVPEINIKVEKKTPSPEKKPYTKKSPDTKKSPQEVTALKKFRHILPRTTTPPKSQSFVQPQPQPTTTTTNQTDMPKVSPTLQPPPLIPPHLQVQQQLTQHQQQQQQQQLATLQSNFINEMIAARNMFFPGAPNLNGIMNYQQAFLNYAKQKEKEQSKLQIQSPMHLQQVLFEHIAKNWNSQDEALQYLRNLGTAAVASTGPQVSSPPNNPTSERKSSKSSPNVDSKKSTSSTTK
ncbi:hypothetical protein ACFFRR_000583 [Megaselia abdita]